jgi:hypothetical protein
MLPSRGREALDERSRRSKFNYIGWVAAQHTGGKPPASFYPVQEGQEREQEVPHNTEFQIIFVTKQEEQIHVAIFRLE